MTSSDKNIPSGVAVAAGVVVLVVGIILKAANDAHNTVCSTGLGAFGQSESSAVHQQCLWANVGSTVGEWALVLGVIAIIGGVALVFLSKNQGPQVATASAQPTNLTGGSTVPRTAGDGRGVQSKPIPQLPAISWDNVIEAATYFSPPRNVELESSIRELSNKRDLRACCFAVDNEGKTAALLLFDNEILRVSCTDGGSSIFYDNQYAGAVVRLSNSENGETVKLGVGRGRVQWFSDLGPLAALQTFVASVRAIPWIEVIQEPLPAPVPAPPPETSLPPTASRGSDGASRVANPRVEGLRRDLIDLKALHDEGLLDENEYESRRSAVLDRLTGQTE
jgi:hypothetical protein